MIGFLIYGCVVGVVFVLGIFTGMETFKRNNKGGEITFDSEHIGEQGMLTLKFNPEMISSDKQYVVFSINKI